LPPSVDGPTQSNSTAKRLNILNPLFDHGRREEHSAEESKQDRYCDSGAMIACKARQRGHVDVLEHWQDVA
jgi:hypothetical protein